MRSRAYILVEQDRKMGNYLFFEDIVNYNLFNNRKYIHFNHSFHKQSMICIGISAAYLPVIV